MEFFFNLINSKQRLQLESQVTSDKKKKLKEIGTFKGDEMTGNGYICSLLLDPNTYIPDTLNLNADEEARQYWFNCFGQLIKKFSEQAARSEHFRDPEADARARR